MADLKWMVRRLKAMSFPEVIWRLSQKRIEKREKKRFGSVHIGVAEKVYNASLEYLDMSAGNLWINYENPMFNTDKDICLIGGFDYVSYEKKWNAGFQTEHVWSETFSYDLDYKQRDEIGDARTNWELNRHFQFALLAKNYYASGNSAVLMHLCDLFNDWNRANPFLHGISWTSVMETAIRVSNWCYMYAFLDKSKDVPDDFLQKIKIGIINMTDYISAHYSRYSSANNHLIVEAYAIGQSGILLQYEPWIDLSVKILTEELSRQNYEDGINKELSLHYQSFYLEAMGLMMRLLKKNGRDIPEVWYSMLSNMCRYLADCVGRHGIVVEFGDNDEGKILDLQGGRNDHYNYVLGMFSILLQERYLVLTENDVCETLRWLFDGAEFNEANQKELYDSQKSICYRIGGNTILKTVDGRVVIGMDHAELGFGSIAAHGHADALSIQMVLDEKPFLLDPGTYIYHCDIESRNAFRRTENHNTVCIGGKDQSHMLGAFLWGERASSKLINVNLEGARQVVEAEHDGYAPDVHRRKVCLESCRLIVEDTIETEKNWTAAWLINTDEIIMRENAAEIVFLDKNVHFHWNRGNGKVVDAEYSDCYGVKKFCKKIILSGKGSGVLESVFEWY